MEKEGVVTIVTTTSTREQAKEIARALVTKRLVACAEISGPIESIYPWKGAIEEDQEWVLRLKTSKNILKALEAELINMHPYEVPQILVFHVDYVYAPYERWLRDWVQGEIE